MSDELEAIARNTCPDALFFRGLAAENRFAPVSWGLKIGQQFQFGDLRVELVDRSIVVETSGNLTNLVKYWPMLDHMIKPFFLVHLYGISTEKDYISHRNLWEFLQIKMKSEVFRAWLFPFDKRHGTIPPAARKCFQRCLTDSVGHLLITSDKM
jgi:hypothetical protein